MSEEVKDNKKLVTDLTQKVADLNDKEKLENIIKDNKIIFSVKDKNYRVSKLTQGQSAQARSARNNKYLELLKSNDFVLREQLISIYLEKGIDIVKMEAEIKELQLQIEDIMEKAAPIPTESSTVLKDYESQCDELKLKQTAISVRLTELLEYCLENEINEFANLYLVYLVLEKEVDNKYIKCFETYQEFLDSSQEDLIFSATYNLSMLAFSKNI